MDNLPMSGVLNILTISTSLIICIVFYLRWKFQYWERKNMPYLETGITTLKKTIWQPEAYGSEKRQYIEARARKLPHVGLYALTVPVYMPVDPQFVKNIMLKDFNHFVDRGIYYNEKDDPISAHLFALEGARWRNLRIKMTPTFTSGKLKGMFPTMLSCSQPLIDYIEGISATPEPTVDLKVAASCFTTDVMGKCAFGLECNSFKDPNSMFRKNLQRNLTLTTYEHLKGYLAFTSPEISRALGISPTPPAVAQFFAKVVEDAVQHREQTGETRKDFLQLLINMKNGENKDFRLTMEELIAQTFVFLLAGFESSSLLMGMCLYEMAVNKEIQYKAREEVQRVVKNHDGQLTYDAIMDMKYLAQILSEALRKYPPLPMLMRKCIADYKIPDTDIVINKGTQVTIPVIGIHHDEEYFPDPQKFDPDRFTDENKTKILPFTYMPFGEGPRMCIAFRFGLLQIKIGLATLLQQFDFSLNKNTKVPMETRLDSFTLMTVHPLILDVKKLEK